MGKHSGTSIAHPSRVVIARHTSSADLAVKRAQAIKDELEELITARLANGLPPAASLAAPMAAVLAIGVADGSIDAAFLGQELIGPGVRAQIAHTVAERARG